MGSCTQVWLYSQLNSVLTLKTLFPCFCNSLINKVTLLWRIWDIVNLRNNKLIWMIIRWRSLTVFIIDLESLGGGFLFIFCSSRLWGNYPSPRLCPKILIGMEKGLFVYFPLIVNRDVENKLFADSILLLLPRVKTN